MHYPCRNGENEVRDGDYFRCLWSAVYAVKRPVTIGVRPLRPLQEFTFDVATTGVAKGESVRARAPR